MNSSLNSTAASEAKARPALVEGVLQAHDAEADGAVAGVGGRGGFGRVEVDVDDVVERADGDGDGFAELLVIDARRHRVMWVSRMTEPRLQTAVSSAEVLRVISVQRLRRVDDADVVLRAADVAGVLEGDPWVAGLEEHLEHGFPELEGGELARPDLAVGGQSLRIRRSASRRRVP